MNEQKRADRGICSVCFGTYVIRRDGRIRQHGGLLIRNGSLIGTGFPCTGAGLLPYTGPTCSQTGKLCPKSKDPRRCAHDEAVIIPIAWMPAGVPR